MTKILDRLVDIMRPKWHTIPDTPEHLHDGLYVVAQFDKDSLVCWTYYACLEGYWGPNTAGCGITHPTHYMSIDDFHQLLEITPKE